MEEVFKLVLSIILLFNFIYFYISKRFTLFEFWVVVILFFIWIKIGFY